MSYWFSIAQALGVSRSLWSPTHPPCCGNLLFQLWVRTSTHMHVMMLVWHLVYHCVYAPPSRHARRLPQCSEYMWFVSLVRKLSLSRTIYSGTCRARAPHMGCYRSVRTAGRGSEAWGEMRYAFSFHRLQGKSKKWSPSLNGGKNKNKNNSRILCLIDLALLRL